MSIPASVWLRLFSIAAVVGVVLLAAGWALKSTRAASAYSLSLLYLLLFLIWSGFFFPVSQDSEVGAFASAPINWPNLALTTVLALVSTYLATRGYASYVLAAAGIFIAGNLLVAFIPQNTIQASMSRSPTLAASSTMNIFVVSFDGLSGETMQRVLADDADFKKRLSGFTLFTNAGASSPATSASIAAELYGNRNYKLWYDTQSEFRRHDPDSLLTNVLLRHGYRVTTFGAYGMEFEGTSLTPSRQLDQTGLMLLEATLARTLTRFAVPKGGVHEIADSYLSLVNALSPEDEELVEQILASPTNPGIKEHTMTIIDYRDFLDGLVVAGDEPAAFFVHFTHTHIPVEFDAECEYRSDEPDWHRLHQNFDGALDEHRCAATQLSWFLEKIEQLGVLENSLIVLKSDHGRPTRYSADGSIESTPINGNERFGLSRYSPFLAVRPLDSDPGAEMAIDTQPVILDDLARTLCEESEIQYQCQEYPGYNIVRDTVDPTAEVTAFIVESPDSNHRYEEHIAITVPRGISLVHSLHAALEE